METKKKLRVVYGIPYLGGHDFPQLVFRTTLATIGRGNTRLTNRRSARVINLYQRGEKSTVSRKWVTSLPTRGVEAKMIAERGKKKGKKRESESVTRKERNRNRWESIIQPSNEAARRASSRSPREVQSQVERTPELQPIWLFVVSPPPFRTPPNDA